jgi:hypothetical protein
LSIDALQVPSGAVKVTNPNSICLSRGTIVPFTSSGLFPTH